MTEEITEKEDTKKKSWPKQYYATDYELTLKNLRSCSPAKARSAGVLGWRKPVKEN